MRGWISRANNTEERARTSAVRASALYRAVSARASRGGVLPGCCSVSRLLVSATRKSTGDGADSNGHSSGQRARRPAFGLHSGSYALVWSEQLAVAAYSRGTASRNSRISCQDVVAERA